jgi:hypothetical protein
VSIQLLVGHSKIECTVRYLSIEVDNALAIAEQVDVRLEGGADALCSALADRVGPEDG